MCNLFPLAKPFLHRIDPETAHQATLTALKTGLVPTVKNLPQSPVRFKHLTFPNKIGLAAGFDKNAEVIAPMLGQGFGFVEVGTVTPKLQEGNPRPRVFRDTENAAIINRMGFPNKGVKVFKTNLEKFRSDHPAPSGLVGVNIGMNKDQDNPAADYTLLVRELGTLADYLTVNISSPNTPGLRDLQRRDHLLKLIAPVLNERDKTCKAPVFVKLSPDMDAAQMEDTAKALMESGIDGLILTNTTLDRPDYLEKSFANEKGGLSGRPLTQKATQVIKIFSEIFSGDVFIIGVGGIESIKDVNERLDSGASLVQLYTSLVFQGPALVKTLVSGLSAA
jgi:dihydroorotate dehydrogenase